jgi:hypothetical protein
LEWSIAAHGQISTLGARVHFEVEHVALDIDAEEVTHLAESLAPGHGRATDEAARLYLAITHDEVAMLDLEGVGPCVEGVGGTDDLAIGDGVDPRPLRKGNRSRFSYEVSSSRQD